MPADLPFWLKLILRLERAVGGPVEAAVHSDTYFDLVTELNRGTRRLTDAVESVSKRGLHLLYGEGLGLDSIDILEVALVVSQRYGFQMRSDDEDNVRIFKSLASLAQHIGAHRKS